MPNVLVLGGYGFFGSRIAGALLGDPRIHVTIGGIPMLWLQIRMRDLARAAALRQVPLAEPYWRYARAWLLLGVPAFAAVLGVLAAVTRACPAQHQDVRH